MSLVRASEPVLHALFPYITGDRIAPDGELRPCLHRLTWHYGKGSSQERAIESPSSMPIHLAV
jgi:hypothetical protein